MEISEEVLMEYGFSDGASISTLFDNVYKRIRMLMLDKALVTVYVKTSDGTAVPDVLVTGVTAENGSALYTDKNGMLSGFANSGNVTLAISGYLDLNGLSESKTFTKGETYFVTLTVGTRNFFKFTSTNTVRISGIARRIDVTAVGGGGGGGGYTTSIGDASSGGGGGGYCNIRENVNFSTRSVYTAVVGSGGVAGQGDTNSVRDGKNGGASSFLGVSASGGYGAAAGSLLNSVGKANGATGNGNGGDGYTRDLKAQTTSGPYEGTAGSVAGYSSYTETVIYGGGGGGGNGDGSTMRGAYGGGYGGTGGWVYVDKSTLNVTHGAGSSGQNGFGGGGGGGATLGEYYSRTYGGAGGSGCVAVRIHF